MLPKKLSGKALRHLRALGHTLDPVIAVGKSGLTEMLAKEAVRALEKHELIKVRVMQEAPSIATRRPRSWRREHRRDPWRRCSGGHFCSTGETTRSRRSSCPRLAAGQPPASLSDAGRFKAMPP